MRAASEPVCCPLTSDCWPATAAAAVPRRSPHPDDPDLTGLLPDATVNCKQKIERLEHIAVFVGHSRDKPDIHMKH